MFVTKLQPPKNASAKYSKYYFAPDELSWEQRHKPAKFGPGIKNIIKQSDKISRKPIIINILFQSTVVFADVFSRHLLAPVLDTGISEGISTNLWIYLGLLSLCVFLIAISSALIEIFRFAQIYSIYTPLFTQLSRRIHRGSYHLSTKIPPGELVNVLDEDISSITFYTRVRVQFLVSSTGALLAGFFMLRINWLITTITITLIPVGFYGIFILQKPLQKRFKEVRQERGNLSTLTTDAVVGLRVLKGLGAHQEFLKRYKHLSAKVRDSQLRTAIYEALLGFITELIPVALSIMVVVWGAFLVFYGQLTPGEIVALWSISSFLNDPLKLTIDLASSRSFFLARAPHLTKVYDEPEVVHEGKQKITFPAKDADLIHLDTGIRFKAGKLTGIVSPSVAESSKVIQSLARLDDEKNCGLLRWNAPLDSTNPHKIFIENTNLSIQNVKNTNDVTQNIERRYTTAEVRLNQLPIHSFTNTLVVSPAISKILTGSLGDAVRGSSAGDPYAGSLVEIIEDSVAIAKNDPSYIPLDVRTRDKTADDKILLAIKNACAQDVYNSLGGLDGVLQENGRNLSGGQRQRIALARALYTQAPILGIIDPSSALDSSTELFVAESIKDARAGLTTIMVTNSPIMLSVCDEVIFWDPASCKIQMGTHNQILSNSLSYKEVVARDYTQVTNHHLIDYISNKDGE